MTQHSNAAKPDDTITGNAERDQLLFDAINTAKDAGHPITAAVLSAEHLPPDFNLGDDELAAMLAAIAAQNGEPVAEAEPEGPPVTLDECNARLVEAQNALCHARGDLIALENRRRDARGKLANAISAFQRGLMPKTAEQNVREHLAAEAQLRADVATGKVSPRRAHRPGNSAVDLAAYRGANSANRRYGPAFRRGGFGIESRGMVNTDPRRGPVFNPPKLPSER